ncbi:unnamed protein product, partial [marine sediment metagenome]
MFDAHAGSPCCARSPGREVRAGGAANVRPVTSTPLARRGQINAVSRLSPANRGVLSEMSDQVQLSIIGCGGIAGAHVGGYEKLVEAGYDKFRIVAVCDTNERKARKMARRLGESVGARPNVYATVEEMLKSERLDGADICTPHAFHHTAAIPCLRKGVHVMVEKPVGITVRATRKMMEAAEKGGAMIAAAEQVRRCLGARAIEWAINEKKMMGTPRFFTMEVFGVMPFNWR